MCAITCWRWRGGHRHCKKGAGQERCPPVPCPPPREAQQSLRLCPRGCQEPRGWSCHGSVGTPASRPSPTPHVGMDGPGGDWQGRPDAAPGSLQVMVSAPQLPVAEPRGGPCPVPTLLSRPGYALRPGPGEWVFGAPTLSEAGRLGVWCREARADPFPWVSGCVPGSRVHRGSPGAL